MLMPFHLNQVKWVGSIICVSQMREQAAEIKNLMVTYSPGMRAKRGSLSPFLSPLFLITFLTKI